MLTPVGARRYTEDLFKLRGIDVRFSAPATDEHAKLGADVRRDVLLTFKEAANNAARQGQRMNGTIDIVSGHGIGTTVRLIVNRRVSRRPPAADGERVETHSGSLRLPTRPACGDFVVLQQYRHLRDSRLEIGQVQRPQPSSGYCPGIVEIAGSLGDDLHEDQILRRADADRTRGDLHACCAADGLFFERQESEDQIDPCAGSG